MGAVLTENGAHSSQSDTGPPWSLKGPSDQSRGGRGKTLKILRKC